MLQCPSVGLLDGLTNVRSRIALMPYPLRMASRSCVWPLAFFHVYPAASIWGAQLTSAPLTNAVAAPAEGASSARAAAAATAPPVAGLALSRVRRLIRMGSPLRMGGAG